MFDPGSSIWKDGNTNDVLVFMPGKLQEVPREKSDRMRGMIQRRAKQVVVRRYADEQDGPGGLRALAEQCGFRLSGDEETHIVSLAEPVPTKQPSTPDGPGRNGE